MKNLNLALFGMMFLASEVHSASYRLESLRPAEARGQFGVADIDNMGRTVGQQFRAYPQFESEAWVQDSNGFRTLEASYATAVNDHGWILADESLFIDQSPVDLGTLGGTRTLAEALNNAGQVSGLSENTNGELMPFIWESGTISNLVTDSQGWQFIRITGMNDNGLVVGNGMLNGQDRAFAIAKGAITDLGSLNSGDFGTSATGVNNLGQVVGGSGGQPFVWQEGLMHPLPVGDGFTAVAHDINNVGQVVGAMAIDGNPTNRTAALWDVSPGKVPSLVFGHRTFPTWDVWDAVAINDSGHIVGDTGYQISSYILTPVPEPVNVLLILSALPPWLLFICQRNVHSLRNI